MWRNNFQPGQEKVALIGRVEPAAVPVPPMGRRETMRGAVEGLDWRGTSPDMVRVEAESIPFFYAGNLTAARELFRDFPVNTDDRPVIEYQTPKTFRKVAEEDPVIWCVGPRLIGWIERIFAACPLEEDPVWAGHPASNAHLVKAGEAFHQAMVGKATGDFESVEAEWSRFKSEWEMGVGE